MLKTLKSSNQILHKTYLIKGVSLLLTVIMIVSLVPIGVVSVGAATSADLSTSQNGINFICSVEGFHSKCYSDYSQSSIGYGTKCSGSSAQPHKSGLHSITKAKAMEALKSELKTAEANVRKQTKGIKMNQDQFDTLVSLCYNCGGGTTKISNSPLVKYLKGKLSKSNAYTQYSSYIVTAGGKVLQGLINRRKKEANLFFSDSNIPTEPNSNEIIRVARSQKGSYGSDVNKFTTWYYEKKHSAYWCAIFILWCANQVGEYKVSIPNEASCAGMKKWYASKGLYHTYESGYSPQKGDIVFYDTSRQGTYNHVEFVSESGYITQSGKKYVRSLGGNTSNDNFKGQDYVSEKNRKVNESSCKVVGFAHPKYKGSTSYKITDNGVSNIKNKSAKFSVSVSPKAPVDKVTLFFSKKSESSELEAIKENVVFENLKKTKHYNLYGNSTNKKISKVEFNTESDTTIGNNKVNLSEGTPYKYRYLVKIGDKKYLTGVKEFSTKNNPPGDILNFTVANATKEIGIGGTATATWKAAARADSYEVRVVDSSNNNVQIKTIKNKTSFTTEKINKAGTYTITIKAVNNGGSSKTVSATFKVNNNLTILFNYGNGRSEKRTTNFGGTVTAPDAPKKEGYTFVNWKSDTGNTVKASAKINNLKTSSTYTAQFYVNQYTVNIIDGISNSTLKTLKLDYDSEFDVAKYISDNNISIPTHNNYAFEGYSEDKYVVDAEKHNIYLRYKWDSKNKVETKIEKVERAKSNSNLSITDGYSVDIDVSITNPTDTTVIKGRAIVAMKTSNGRLLIETESSAFVLYPKENEKVSKSIEVFVPYIAGEHDGLPAILETYIVNNYTSAGIISDVATDTEKIAETNKKTWQYSTTKPTVDDNGVTEVNENEDYTLYDYVLTTETTKQSLEPTLKGYDYTGTSAWYKVGGGTIDYVNSWPTLGNSLGSKYNNTSGAGKNLYNRFNNKSKLKTAVSTETSRLDTSTTSGVSHIYYHWCRNVTHEKSKMNYNVTGSKCYGKENTSNYYKQFHAFWLNTQNGDTVDLLNTDFNSKMYRRVLHKGRTDLDTSDYRDVCNDSWWWSKNRISVDRQTWNQYTRYYTHKKTETKTGSTKNFAEVPTNSNPDPVTRTEEGVPLKTTVKNTVNYTATKYYAFKTTKNELKDENIYTLNGKVSADYSGENAVIYVYKNNQMSDSNAEYISTTTIGENGVIKIDDAQLREKCTPQTGDFTIAIALAGEENAMVAGTVVPNPEDRIKYSVKFVAEVSDSTDFDGTINVESQAQVISTQSVEEGADAQLPDESLIPEKEGYHFVAWNNTATDIHKDLIVEAIYEKNDYAIAFIDWNNGKVDIQHFKYDDVLELPELPETEEDTTVEWVVGNTNNDNTQTVDEFFANGGTVKEDMVISLKYSTKEFEVAIVDNEGEDVDIEDGDDHNIDELDTQNVKYGSNIQLDVVEEQITEEAGCDMIFSGWKNAETGEYLDTIEVTDDMTIYPIYQFADTVDTPEADVTTGEYTSEQTVTLSCENPNAVIYYTTDKSDPAKSKTAQEYTEPITLTETTVLQFCATAVGMNNSGTVLELYAINTATSGVKNHLVTVYSNLPESEGEYYQALVVDSKKLKTDEFEDVTGYIFNGFFYDEELTDEFDVSAETITSQTTLYAAYTPKEYTVTFYDDDETTVLSSQKVSYGTPAEEPAPTKDGFVFIGWDKEGYDFVTADGNYIAQYVPEDEYARVSLNKSKVSMIAGSSKQLKATVTPDIDVELDWESSDPYVAEVDDNGLVTLNEAGMATITVTVESTGESASCEFIVSENPDENITLAGGSILDIDSQGYLRRIPCGANTVAELRKEFVNENLKFAKVDEASQTETVLAETDRVGTGTVISLVDGDDVLDSMTVIMTGDSNSDGAVDVRDSSLVQRYIARLLDLDYTQQLASDVNGDGSVDVRDASMIQRFVAKIISFD